MRAVDAGALGSGDLAAFNAARNVALTEIGRVLSSPNLTGVLTNEARQGVSELIGPNATLAQIYSAANILQQDMENRKTGLDDEISTIKDQLKNAPSGAVTPPPPPMRKNDNTAKGHVIDIGGKRYQYKGTGDTADLANYSALP